MGTCHPCGRPAGQGPGDTGTRGRPVHAPVPARCWPCRSLRLSTAEAPVRVGRGQPPRRAAEVSPVSCPVPSSWPGTPGQPPVAQDGSRKGLGVPPTACHGAGPPARRTPGPVPSSVDISRTCPLNVCDDRASGVYEATVGGDPSPPEGLLRDRSTRGAPATEPQPTPEPSPRSARPSPMAGDTRLRLGCLNAGD